MHAVVSCDSSSLLSEDQLQCSICLDVFTDPVTTPCGHNFCKSCLTQWWEKSQHCHCPLCKEKFTKRPELKINTTLREIADNFKKKSGPDKPEVLCDVCTGEKLKALKSCLDCVLSLCETHLEPHNHVPRLKKRKLINPVENVEDYICQNVPYVVPIEEESRERKTQLEKTLRDVQQMIQDRLKKIQEMKHSVQLSKLCRIYFAKLPKTLNDKFKETVSTELKRIQQYAERLIFFLHFTKKVMQETLDVTLDPDTAHPYLILSADGKQVTLGDTEQDLPDTPQRFDECVCVLGKQSFSSGRLYYEVQVRGKTDWTLGVARENINRKGKITLRPQNGFWTVILRNENRYTACAGPPVPLTLREKVETVGVFVDYEEGLVSFYDVKSSSHIYSFTAQSFTEKLYPYFSPCLNEGGKNSAPLIISPVFNTE
ncbi:E3 ubiquitin-protein ligase TRIM39-like isoform X3 [Ictalurus furcatus]|uniref:E3 ubiquitin-protein ligase TRIM39-like isoform X3 n=1 Tax=Ictalurus furcatus TaxID=66913 RepID=UPI002350B7A8|nr:E3 ubiquitin-protein ligase TRIM39-like isoform X3 [Ictalurus furcatus]